RSAGPSRWHAPELAPSSCGQNQPGQAGLALAVHFLVQIFLWTQWLCQTQTRALPTTNPENKSLREGPPRETCQAAAASLDISQCPTRTNQLNTQKESPASLADGRFGS